MKTATMENNNWPDKVRLKMIEKSEFYPDDKQVYQYGFYDGYQYASEQCQKRDELIKVQDEYIKLLTDELDEVVGMMAAHGWKSHRYEQGKQSRDKIERLKSEL